MNTRSELIWITTDYMDSTVCEVCMNSFFREKHGIIEKMKNSQYTKQDSIRGIKTLYSSSVSLGKGNRHI